VAGKDDDDDDEKLPPEDGPRTVEANPTPPERLFLEGPRSRFKELGGETEDAVYAGSGR
jgi:hypothetical protein